MGRKTVEESQKTKDLILTSAEYVFLEKGYARASMEDISKRAGISRGAVYGHYKNKQELALAMCQRAFVLLREMVAGVKILNIDSLYEIGIDYLRKNSGSSSLQRVGDILYSKCENSAENLPLIRYKNFYKKIIRYYINKAIQTSIKNGEISNSTDVKLAVVYLLSTLEGLYGVCIYDIADASWGQIEQIWSKALLFIKKGFFV